MHFLLRQFSGVILTVRILVKIIFCCSPCLRVSVVKIIF
jgi:hypothetical protein